MALPVFKTVLPRYKIGVGGFDSLLLPPVLIPLPRRFRIMAIVAINLMIQRFVFGLIESALGSFANDRYISTVIR